MLVVYIVVLVMHGHTNIEVKVNLIAELAIKTQKGSRVYNLSLTWALDVDR